MSTLPTGNHQTVEDLIRYAAGRLSAARIDFKPSKLSRLIRRAGTAHSREALDAYLEKELDRAARIDAYTWRSFETFVNGYADPTGARAAEILDRQDAATSIRRRRASQLNSGVT